MTLLSTESFSPDCDPELRGHINTEHSFVLRDILASRIGLRIKCSFESNGREKLTDSGKRKLLPCTLEIALYAPFSMFQEIKEWSEENDVFLQDPTFCFCDAKYCNPQRLSLHFDAPRMVSEALSQASEHRMRLRNIIDEDDFLDKYLASKVELTETEQPSAVKTALKRSVACLSPYTRANSLPVIRKKHSHLCFEEKRDGLCMDQRPMYGAFLIMQTAVCECDQSWMDSLTVHPANNSSYINVVSESGSKSPPPPFRGGVIADPMGLGKTLTMIALAATDLSGSTVNRPDSPVIETRDQFTSVSATLIVVPPPRTCCSPLEPFPANLFSVASVGESDTRVRAVPCQLISVLSC